MKFRNKDKFTVAFLALLFSLPVYGEEAERSGTEVFEEWMKSQTTGEVPDVVEVRKYSKAKRFQVVGPLLGMSERKDFYNTFMLSLGTRYHFSETLAWEMARVSLSFPKESTIASQVRDETEFEPDVQLSRWQLSSSLVWAPIYGKFAWGSKKLVHFDIYGSLGGGVRFARDIQPFGVLGIGMNHHLGWHGLAITPEYRARVYRENRTQATTVVESIFQLGTSWTL